MTPQEFVDTIIAPALVALDLDSIEARELLLGTALQESGLRDIAQEGGGPAFGFFQPEPASLADLRIWLAARHPAWMEIADGLVGGVQEAAYARLHYERAPGVIPLSVAGQAAYYKQWYNTPLGKATTDQYLANWAQADGVVFDAIPLGGAPTPPAQPIPADAVTVAQLPTDPTEPQSVTYVNEAGLQVTETDLGPIPEVPPEAQPSEALEAQPFEVTEPTP